MGNDQYSFDLPKGKLQANYVEITEEMQQKIDAENKAAEDAKLQGGLNGNKGKDLDKGVAIEGGKTLSNEEIAARFGEIREGKSNAQIFFNNTRHSIGKALKGFGEAVLGGAMLIGKGLAMLTPTSCTTKEDLMPDPVGANATLTYNPKSYDIAARRCEILNMSDEDFDTAINANNMLSDSEKARLTALDFSKQTSDGIKFNYGAEKLSDGTGRAYINIPEGENGLKLYLDSSSRIPAGDVIKYIEVLNPELECDGEKVHFEEKNGNAQVVVENGFTHQIGDKIEIKDGSALGNFNKMLGVMGFEPASDEVATISGNSLLMNCQVGRGAYSNEQNTFDDNPNFAFELVERGDLGNVTNGNPKVNFKIFDQEITGKLFNENGDTVIKDETGKELVRLTQKQNYDIGAEDDPDPWDGVLVQVNGEDFAFISDGDMGVIDKTNGTFMTTYSQASKGFDMSGLKQAEDLFNEKENNLEDARKIAGNNYNALYEILGAEASADASIHIG